MAEPPDKKVDKGDILDVFHNRTGLPVADGGEYVGKWELSSGEVAELVNDSLGLSEDEGISRQAIHRRLERMDEVVKIKHGRTVTWRLEQDRLVMQQAGNGGSGGHGGYQNPPTAQAPETETGDGPLEEGEEERNGMFSRLFSRSDRDGMDLPGIFILAVLAVFGWRAFKSAYNQLRDDPVAKTAYAVLTGGFTVAWVALGVQIGLLWYTSTSGPVVELLSYGVGAAAYTAALLASGGIIGLPAHISKSLLESVGVEG